MTEVKITELEKALKHHQELTKDIKKKLKELDPLKDSSYKALYLKTMKSCTQPFANYNNNLSAYLNNPILANFKKLLFKIEKLNNKLASVENASDLKISKIKKLLNVTDKFELKIKNYSKNLNDLFSQIPESREILETLQYNKKVLMDIKLEKESKLGNDTMDSKNLDELLKEIDCIPQDKGNQCSSRQES